MDMWWLVVALGLATGICSALFGVGGGIIMVPALIFLFDTTQKSAQGISLAVMVPMALVGAIRYRLNPQVDMDTAKTLLLALGAVVGAWIGTHWVRQIPGPVLRRAFAVFIMLVAVRMLASPERPAKPRVPAPTNTEDLEATSRP
jgi:uncharacterized protein